MEAFLRELVLYFTEGYRVEVHANHLSIKLDEALWFFVDIESTCVRLMNHDKGVDQLFNIYEGSAHEIAYGMEHRMLSFL